MPFYYGKRFTSANVGARIIEVECDKCGCKYFYELVRIGTGAETAPYGIGKSAAIRSSEKQAQADSRNRLSHEAELVPCPKCNWINDDLVEGYRRGRFRSLRTLAIGIGTFGTVGSLIGAWFIWVDPAPDHGALPYFLFAGPAISVSLGIALVLLRKWLRSRIQPNREFPLAPRLPPGSSPALVVDEETGRLRRAQTRDVRYSDNSEWHNFQIGRDRLPPVCCCCLKGAVPGTRVQARCAAGDGTSDPALRRLCAARRATRGAFGASRP